MEVIVGTSSILEELRQKSHFNTRPIEAPEARINARAGEEEQDELERCLLTSESALRNIISRWAVGCLEPVSDSHLGIPEELVYDFNIGQRRAAGKSVPVAMAIHAYLVAKTLSLFYRTVTRADLAEIQDGLAAQAEAQLTKLLNTKAEPML